MEINFINNLFVVLVAIGFALFGWIFWSIEKRLVKLAEQLTDKFEQRVGEKIDSTDTQLGEKNLAPIIITRSLWAGLVFLIVGPYLAFTHVALPGLGLATGLGMRLVVDWYKLVSNHRPIRQLVLQTTKLSLNEKYVIFGLLVLAQAYCVISVVWRIKF